MEKNTMILKPRPFTTTFFSWRELTTSIIQGLIITIGTLLTYQYAVHQGYNEPVTRAMVFVSLVTANIFLTLVNRSFFYSIIATMRYKNNLVPLVIGITILLTGLLLYVKPLTKFFEFEHLRLAQLFISMGVGFVSVVWFELVKWVKRSRK
jgi:Ca2+-transporting ATPase